MNEDLTLQIMNKQEIINQCARAIQRNSGQFGWIDDNGFNVVDLPTPQRTGTMTQQTTYAKMKASEIVEQHIQNR